ncbi:MAG: hypothetical protein QOJ90_1168 [Actinomycetota bacterium]|jgi:uncharacterized repeat protein (TIGR03847 family)|nr:hypothetical protein [Actinomycetota bacterium]MDQ1641817.1 hypothetical protein [Actinomycetota bacterium]
MARLIFDYDPPDRFVAGTVGEPGQRTFFLQASEGSRLTSVALEKQQVTVLAERVEALLDEVLRRTAGETSVPAAVPTDAEDTAPLATPIEEEFRVGTMALAWDGSDERVVIEAQAVAEDETDDETALIDETEEGPPLLRVRITGATARAFVKRSLALVAAGRPPCPFCGNPLDPAGHVCPRANGIRRAS